MCLFQNNTEALEITDKTLFLLGNGCSMKYGFPNGKELLLKSFQLIKKHRNSGKYENIANDLYQKLHSFLSILSDLKVKVEWGRIDAVHGPYYSILLEIADEPEVCSNRNKKICKKCIDYEMKDFLLNESAEKYKKCKILQKALKKMYAWDLFAELSEKFDDKLTYGQGEVKFKKINIAYEYDNLAKLLTKTLFYFYINRKKCKAYYNFVKKLKSFSGTIVNLNYDLLLEQEMSQKASFQHIKPHGSFDLIYCEKGISSSWKATRVRKNIYRMSDPNKIVEFFLTPKADPCIFPLNIAYADIKTHKSIQGTNQAKFVREYTIHEVERLKNIIPNCDKVVTIGYSFSENYNKNGLIDKHIIEPLLSKKIYVVGKGNTKDIVDRVKKYYKKAQVLHTDFNGFGDYARQIKFHE